MSATSSGVPARHGVPTRRGLTVRARWMLMSAGVAVACSAVLLIVTLVMTDRLLRDRARDAIGQPVAQPTDQPVNRLGGPGPYAGQPPPGQDPLGRAQVDQTRLDQGRQVTDSVLADVRTAGLATMAGLTVVALGLGWLVAGRMIRPVNRIAETARSVSGARLGERIAMDGPDDELTRLADTFDDMLDRLDTAFAAQRSLVADASHELRTPLAVMRAEVEVALDDPEASVDELRASLVATLGTIDSTSELVDRLLNLSRADAIASVDDLDLADSARQAVAELSVIARGAETPAVDATGLRPAPVRGDRVLLHRLASNLIDNARRHNRPGGGVSVSTSIDADWSVLTVVNDGPVIESGEVERLFDRFHRRVDATAPGAARGSGLGLAIVAAVTRTHGGEVTAMARPVGGLVVTVRLPRAAPAVEGQG